MKNKLRFLGYIAIAAIITLALASCDIMKPINEPGSAPADTPSGPSGTYAGTINGTTYILTVYPANAKAAHAPGDNFTLTVNRSGSEKTSSGKLVGVNGNTLSAQPAYKDAAVFTITVSGSSITDISTDSIAFNNGSTEQGPGSFSSGGKPGNVAVTGVTLAPTSLSLTVGGSTGALTATVAPSNATNKTVSWSTSDASVATVNNGVVTAVGSGTATITVSTQDGGKTATCAVSVTVPVSGVSLNLTSLSLTMGGTQTATLAATVEPSAAANKSVTWTSDNTSVATVNNGVVTAVAAGNATITVTTVEGGKTATCAVTVAAASQSNNVAVTGVTLAPTSLSLTVGGSTGSLTATVAPSNATNKTVSWSTSDASVATVYNGVVTAVGSGTVTITVSTQDGGKTATCAVSVTAPVSGVSLSQTSLSLTMGGTQTATLIATVQPSGAANKSVSWASSNPNVATVNNGVVTAVAAGTATITVTTVEGGKTATCAVTVNPSAVTFNSVTANGSSTQTTTQIELILSQAITGLTSSDITLSGVTGVIKGTLTSSGPTYTLPISGFASGGTLTVEVSSPTGYSVTGGSKTVSIYHYTPPTAVTFSSVTANGSSTQTTTQLTLIFSQAITGLTSSDITLSGVTGVTKGTLSGSGPTYTLPISGFTSGGTLTVAVAKSGYSVSGSPKTLTIYYYSVGTGTGTATLTITFAQITDAAPSITGPTLYRVSKGSPTKAILSVDSPGQYDSISWRVDNTAETGNDSSFTLDAANTAYNLIGEHFLTVAIKKGGVPYNKTVSFKVEY